MKKMTLAERMKFYEKMETEREFLPLLPIYTRIDGRSFHSFTRGMERPYDLNFMNAMIETTRYLVQQTHANIGYTQSDEISLIFHFGEFDSEIFFNRSIFKMTSNIASLATAKFVKIAMDLFPHQVEKMLPTFDCRVIQFPSQNECMNMLIWRVRDAVKNSVSMAASAYFSHNELLGKNTTERLDMLHSVGVNWNDYPTAFKQGTFLQRKTMMVDLSDDELKNIPIKHRPNGKVQRSSVVKLDMPPLNQVLNLERVIFLNAPILKLQQ